MSNSQSEFLPWEKEKDNYTNQAQNTSYPI